MTFLTSHTLTLTLTMAFAAPQSEECRLVTGTRTEQRSFTNADLERMSACRYQTGALSAATTAVAETPLRGDRRTAGQSNRDKPAGAEADWRAQWRSVDQKAWKLRREAQELRQEAAESPRDPKKRVVGRRSPTLLITRAETLEAEARELEDQFNERARREGALPGWLRPQGR